MKVIVRYWTEFGVRESKMNVNKIPALYEKFIIMSVTPYKKDKFKSFDGTNQLFAEDDETLLEDWTRLRYRIDEEGLEYCFNGYSNWEEIKDKEFHKLKTKCLKAIEELRTYVDKKCKQE